MSTNKTNDQNVIQLTMWIMILAQTIGSVDMPGTGGRKMPAPRQYVAIVILWTILSMIGDTDTWHRPAAVFSILATLTAMVLGPFGQRITSFIGDLAGVAQTISDQQQ